MKNKNITLIDGFHFKRTKSRIIIEKINLQKE